MKKSKKGFKKLEQKLKELIIKIVNPPAAETAGCQIWIYTYEL